MTGSSKDERLNPFTPPRATQANESVVVADETLRLEYSTVRRGLQLIYYSIAVAAGVIILTTLIGFFVASSGAPPAATFGFDLFFASGLINLSMILVLIIGSCLTMACPRSDERAFAITSVVCFLLSIAWPFVTTALTRVVALNLRVLILFGGLILVVVSTIAFCSLLKRIGRNISSNELQSKARSMIVWYIILLATLVSWGIASAFFSIENKRTNNGGSLTFTGPVPELIGVAFAITMLIVSLTIIFKYLTMLRTGINELKPR